MSGKLTETEIFKTVTNKKILLGAVAIIFAIAFIAVTSFVPFVITKDKLVTEKFWTDELIVIAITIFSMMATMFIGQASNAQKKKSQIAEARVAFKDSYEKITDSNAFNQWVKKVLQPEDIQAIKERELRKIGIDDYSVLKLEDAEIKSLGENAQKYNGRYYSQISKKQVNAILNLKDGVKRLHLVEPSYYLSVSSIESDKTDSEKSGREQFIKIIKLLFSVGSKIILALIPAIIFASLAKDLTAEEIDKVETWATFISRMFALISSVFFGYIIGCQMNDIDADYIYLRVRIHQRFLQDKTFKPLSQQELAREEFINRVKKENEEYSKSLEYKKETNVENLPAMV